MEAMSPGELYVRSIVKRAEEHAAAQPFLLSNTQPVNIVTAALGYTLPDVPPLNVTRVLVY